MSQWKKFLFLSQPTSIFMSIISTAGIVFLLILGFSFSSKLEHLVESDKITADPIAIGKACHVAAFLYAAILGFSSFQYYIHLEIDKESYVNL